MHDTPHLHTALQAMLDATGDDTFPSRCGDRWPELARARAAATAALAGTPPGGEEVTVTLEDGRVGTLDASWLAEAADTVEWAWQRYAAATNPLSQAMALSELSDVVGDLASFLPGYDPQVGEIARPGDEPSP